jgi:hypothetical protein
MSVIGSSWVVREGFKMTNLIQEKPFTRMVLDEDKDDKYGKVFTVRLNSDQIKQLEWCQKVLSQPKDSTALKQVFEFGIFVLQGDLTGKVLQTVFKNKQKNWRTGVTDPEDL